MKPLHEEPTWKEKGKEKDKESNNLQINICSPIETMPF